MPHERPLAESLESVTRILELDPEEAARRLAYVGIGEEEARLLRALRQPLARARGRVLDAFYRHLLSFEETAALLRDPRLVIRLKNKQRDYFDGLFSGDYGWQHVTNRLRVGLVHHRVGLRPDLYVGAYAVYLAELLPELERAAGGDTARALAAAAALVKVVLLDVALVLEAYFAADRAAVAALHELYESMVCHLPAALVVLDRELRVLSANRRTEDLLGRPHEAARGQRLTDLLGDDALADRCREVLVTGEAQGAVPFERGGRRWLLTLVPMQQAESDDAVAGRARLLLMAEEAGERERLAAAREAADTRARAVMESVGEGIVIIDERGTIEEFNPAAEALFGYDAAELLGRNVKVLMPEPWRGEHDRYIAEYLRTGRRRCLGVGFREVEGLRKGGERFPMELSISEMRIGGRRHFIGVVRDLTARKAAEAERERLAQALEQAADSIFITDADGVIEYANPAFEAVTGYGRHEVVGAKPSMLKSGMHGREFYERLWRTLLAGEPFREVFINRRRDGSLFYEEKTITPIKDAAGRITHFVSTGRDITERIRAEERLRYLAHHDVLTGLPNRALFLDRLEQAMARARRHDRTVAVMFMDLDRFKVINDSLGHAVGDALLRELAGRLRAAVRDGDTVARLGGDEFAVLLEDMARPEDASRVARKLLEALGEPFTAEGREFYLTASIGVSLFPADGDDAHALLKNADAAMYRAKERGRNSYGFYSAELGRRSARRLELETHLRRALERGELELHYQPQLCLRSGGVTGVEALLRWRHPQLGQVSPAEFVPVLEDTGLIVPVGHWVLERACAQLRAWREQGVDGFAVSVNLSAHQLHRPRIAEEILGVLDRTGIDTCSGCLELELTESLLMHEVEETIAKLERLREAGVRIAVDDFGTGYSSLAYLKRFPIHVLKIDRSFVRDLPDDPDDRVIARSILSLGHNLGLDVVAEGVETRAQLEFLRAEGCGAAQGYLFSPPVPAAELPDVVRRLGPDRG